MPIDADEQIQIRCPKCGQRFKVGNELYGRMVECGACEHRFRVTEDTVLRHKKFYPKEKSPIAPVSYARLSGDGFGAPPEEVFLSYEEATANSNFEPNSFGRTLVGIVGSCVLIALLLLFITSDKNSGILQGMTNDRKIILALFVSVLSGGMIVYANPRSRIKAGMFALMGAIALLLTPLFLNQATGNLTIASKPAAQEELPDKEEDSIDDLRDEVGYAPIEKALAASMNKDRVVAVWLRDTRQSNSIAVFDYLRMITRADDTSHVYERKYNKSFLVVLSNSALDLKQVAVECFRLGEVIRTVPELNLIEVKVENSKFDERPEDELGDQKHLAFYEMNLMELEGIDKRRINQAVKRLSSAPPTQSRTDIIRRMNQLLNITEREGLYTSDDRDELFHNLSEAIYRWSDGKDGSPEAMMQVVAFRHANQKEMNATAIRFLVEKKQRDVIPILHQLWEKQPQKWEEIYILCGEAAEKYITSPFAHPSLPVKLSAFRIASRVGTRVSLNALRAVAAGDIDQETKTACQNAIRNIEERIES
jgi:hypothetical protein